MYKNYFVSAIIAAAGQGKRMKSNVNKQYLNLGHMPILAHTLKAFLECKSIDEIIIIVGRDEVEGCKKDIVEKYYSHDRIKIVRGGKERQESIYNGLEAIDDRSDIIITHDGARPFVTKEIINTSIEEAIDIKAVGAGVPVKDTIKIVNDDKFISNTPDRKRLWSMQTPQTFMKEILLEAHRNAIKEDYLGTDDCVLVERIGYPVKMIMGSYENIKITTPEDLIIGEAILKNRSRKTVNT